MYQPAHFKEERLEVQHALIKAHSFGLLISNSAGGILANGVPFILDEKASALGTLKVHVARANAQWRDIERQKILAVFQGPQAYISPSNYETKRETGKVVPTWNYVMVQARGTARVHQNSDWLKPQVEALTSVHEGQRSTPWAVSDAPDDYIASQLRGIVGIEIVIESIEGKWKVSQNRPEADRRGVVAGLKTTEPDMADLVGHYGGSES